MRQLHKDTATWVEGASHGRPGSVLEIVAISVAWPLCLIRFGTGLLAGHPFDALQGLVFFFLVVLYTLVRLSQVSRTD